MLDELILGGEIQETSKKKVLSAIQAQDSLQEVLKVIHFNFLLYSELKFFFSRWKTISFIGNVTPSNYDYFFT